MLSFFERWTNPFPEIDNRQVPPRKLLAFCCYYTRGFWRPLILVGISGFILAVLEVSLFAFMGQIVDWLNAANRQTFLHDESRRLWLMSIVVLLVLPICNALGSIIRNQSLMGNFPMAVRWRMHRQLLEQSMAFYQNEFSGRIAAKVMQTALAVRQLMVKIIDMMIYVVVYFFSMFVLFADLHPALIVPIALWFLGYIGLQIYYVPRLKAISQQQANARSTMTGRITDAYTNIMTVKLFAHTRREADYARYSMSEFLQTVYTQFRYVSWLDIFMSSMNYGLIFAVTATGIALWLQEYITAGAIATAVAMALRLNGMSHWVMWEVSALFEQIGTATDGMNMLALPRRVRDCPDAKDLQLHRGEIRFEHVCFSYQDNDETATRPAVIQDFNLHIQPGEKIGLVGRSGAGKSTLIHTLLRFYDIQSGKILIDGQNIADIRQDSLRAHIAVVTQDTSLLHRSVRDNILYGNPDAGPQQLQQAIEQAEADCFITDLSDLQNNRGLDAQVGERGVKLSGGQRQRIALARVFLKDAPILILDEATSALDSEVEAAIQTSLMKLMQGKTVIAIAHRLSTIAEMDRLIVLDNGKIAEEGSHNALLARGGIYARLWARQTGGYLGDE